MTGPALDFRRKRHARNLVVVRAGDESLHTEWMAGATRDFDVFVSYYGRVPDKHKEHADVYEWRPGPKWPCIHDLISENAWAWDEYDAFWFPDDDLSANTALLNRMFSFFRAFGLSLAQPALTKNSYFSWRQLLQDDSCHLRYTRFIEVMAPIFSREALQLCAPSFSESRSGWGLDWLWPELCTKANLGGIAVIDATPVRHTRPLGGSLYSNHPDMNPLADEALLIEKYSLADARAVGKYIIDRKVRDVPLSPMERLRLWIRRANGRRKRIRHARRRAVACEGRR